MAKKTARNKKKNKARSERRQRKREAMNSGGDKKGKHSSIYKSKAIKVGSRRSVMQMSTHTGISWSWVQGVGQEGAMEDESDPLERQALVVRRRRVEPQLDLLILLQLILHVRNLFSNTVGYCWALLTNDLILLTSERLYV